jgi:hypothetical protein
MGPKSGFGRTFRHNMNMSDRVENLEKAVSELSPDELRQFSAWFVDFDQARWEMQIEKDAKSGRLDFLAEEARREKSAGKLKEL